jgi:nitrate reductase gamma subunit
MAFMNLPISNLAIDIGSLILLAFIILGVAVKIKGGSLHHFYLWQVYRSDREEGGAKTRSSGVGASIASTFVNQVLLVRVLRTCNKVKRLAHLAIFWGFVSLALSTTLAFFYNRNNLILPLTNPIKIFGNAGGILVVLGFLGMFYVRYQDKTSIWRITRTDVFLLTLFFTVVTGFLTQQAIYSNLGSFWISATFWLHIALIILLLGSAPYTKFFHAVTKPVALFYEEIDRRSGREPLLPEELKSASPE